MRLRNAFLFPLLALAACSSAPERKAVPHGDARYLEAFLENEGQRAQLSEQEIPWEQGDYPFEEGPPPELLDQEEKRQKALERYRQLRRQQSTRPAPSRRQAPARATRPAPQARRPRAPVAPPPPAAQDPQEAQELKIEIEQNLAYYCIQEKTGRRFGSPADCDSFTQSVRHECSGGQEIWTRNVLRCVKRRLGN